MRTGIPLFNVLNVDGTTYNGNRTWDLPKRRNPGKWRDAADGGDAIVQEDQTEGDWIELEAGRNLGTGHGGGGKVGFYLTTAPRVLEWFRPGARLFLAEGAGAHLRKGGHVIYARARLIREITLEDDLVPLWPSVYLFLLMAARDRGELDRIEVIRGNFSRIVLRGGDLRGSRFLDCSFTGSNLQGCWFDGSDFQRCNFEAAYLWNAWMRRCSFRSVSFNQANLFYTDFGESLFAGVRHNLALIGYTNMQGVKGADTIRETPVPAELADHVDALNAAGYGVVPSRPEALQSLADYELDAAGDTNETNWHGFLREDPY